MSDTLILNRGWIPIHIMDWHKAIALLYKEHANALDADMVTYCYTDWVKQSIFLDDYPKIGTVKYKVAIPEVMVLTTFDRLPLREIKFTRQSIFQRDNYTCQYCGVKFKKNDLEKEHVIPKCQGGKNSWDNIVSACTPCNSKKRDRTPEQAGMKLIRKPRPPDWFNPHNRITHHPNKKKQWDAFLIKVNGDKK